MGRLLANEPGSDIPGAPLSQVRCGISPCHCVQTSSSSLRTPICRPGGISSGTGSDIPPHIASVSDGNLAEMLAPGCQPRVSLRGVLERESLIDDGFYATGGNCSGGIAQVRNRSGVVPLTFSALTIIGSRSTSP